VPVFPKQLMIDSDCRQSYAARHTVKKFWLAVPVFFFSLPLVAQEYPRFEIVGGYQFIHVPDRWDASYLHGLSGQFEFNINRIVGIVSDFGFGIAGAQEQGTDFDEKFIAFMTGPRFGYRTDKFRVFGQAIFGEYRNWLGADRETDIEMALGGGLDIDVNKRIAIRAVQIDWMRNHHKPEFIFDIFNWTNNLRIISGIVFKLGRSGN
jgi:hypothetical protein